VIIQDQNIPCLNLTLNPVGHLSFWLIRRNSLFNADLHESYHFWIIASALLI
jgi:hypothetical protein